MNRIKFRLLWLLEDAVGHHTYKQCYINAIWRFLAGFASFAVLPHGRHELHVGAAFVGLIIQSWGVYAASQLPLFRGGNRRLARMLMVGLLIIPAIASYTDV